MRLMILAALIVGACTTYEVPDVAPGTAPAPALAPATGRPPGNQAEAVAAYRRVADRVEPVAEALCRRENPRAPAQYCDFALIALTDPSLAPNAYQTIDRGRPVIAFSVSLLRQVRNDDEIAFILGHEAGHQISNHIAKSAVQSQLAATLASQLAAATGGASAASIQRAGELGALVGSRAFSKRFELEADVVGAYIADLAGYDANLGAQSFARFVGGSNAPLSTHPPSAQRLATVQAVAAQIRAQRAAGRVPSLPRL